MTLKVKVSKEKIYKKLFSYLAIENNWNLTSTDLDIANELFLMNYSLLNTMKDFDLRMDKLFSKETKDNLYTKLNLSYNTFNNSLTKLRKIGLIQYNKLHKNISNINIDKGEITLTINMLINDKS